MKSIRHCLTIATLILALPAFAEDKTTVAQATDDSAWLQGIWIHERTDKPGPEEPTCHILKLGAGGDWVWAGLWGTPQKPLKAEVHSRGTGAKLQRLGSEWETIYRDAGAASWLPKPEYNLSLPEKDGSSVNLGMLARKDAGTIVFHNFHSIHSANEYTKAGPQLQASLQKLLPDVPAPRPVRQRFVPKPGNAAKGNGANFTALHQMKMDKPGVLMLMAHVGVGDSFPVAEEHQAKAFDVKIVAGHDDMLTLEIQSAASFESHDLKRDGSVSMQIAGHKFTISYPSVTVNPDSKPTTDKAMIIVNRFP